MPLGASWETSTRTLRCARRRRRTWSSFWGSSIANAFVVDCKDGFFVVLDRESDDMKEEVLQSLALTLSVRLAQPAFATLNYHDELLHLWLYDGKGNELAWEWMGMFSGWRIPGGKRADAIATLRSTFATTANPRRSMDDRLRVKVLEWAFRGVDVRDDVFEAVPFEAGLGPSS